MEQQERRRRTILNREIKAFAEKIAEAASTSVRALSLPGHSIIIHVLTAWGDVRVGYSVPRVIIRGRSIPHECSVATNN
jgi:hypothetical protein